MSKSASATTKDDRAKDTSDRSNQRSDPISTSTPLPSSSTFPDPQTSKNRVREETLSNVSDGYFDHFAAYLPDVQGVANYVRKGLQELAPAEDDDERNRNRELLLYSSYQKYAFFESRRQSLLLLLGYANGFQIWDVSDLEDMKEVYSKRQCSVRMLCMLAAPATSSLDHLWSQKPLVGLLSNGEVKEFLDNKVRILSLSSERYLHELTLPSKVFSIAANTGALVALLESSAYIFDLSTMKCKFNVSVYQNTWKRIPLALGQQWLALAGHNTPPTPMNTPTGVAGTASVDVRTPNGLRSPSLSYPNYSPKAVSEGQEELGYSVKNAAQDVASTLYYVGKLSKEKLSSYLLSDSSPSVSNSRRRVSTPPQGAKNGDESESIPVSKASAGVVQVFDTASGRSILHFQAHSAPISCLQFDTSGMRLATASRDGQHIHVFDLLCSPGSQSPRLLYKLVRGITTATIQSMSFSQDSRWLVAATSRGTAHIFAINPDGGPVDSASHVPRGEFEEVYASGHTTNVRSLARNLARDSYIRLPVVGRIRFPVPSPLDPKPMAEYKVGDDRCEGEVTSLPNAAIVGLTCSGSSVYISTPHGIMLSHEIMPIAQSCTATNLSASPIGDSFLLSYSALGAGQVESAASDLMLQPAVQRRWDICRRVTWDELPLSVEVNADVIAPLKECGDTSMIKSLEVVTHSRFGAPLWAIPRVTIKTYDGKATGSSGSQAKRPNSTFSNLTPLMIEGASATPLQIKRFGPTLGELASASSLGSQNGLDGSASSTPRWSRDPSIGSSPVLNPALTSAELGLPILQLTESIYLALSTPLDENIASLTEDSPETEHAVSGSSTMAEALSNARHEYFASEDENKLPLENPVLAQLTEISKVKEELHIANGQISNGDSHEAAAGLMPTDPSSTKKSRKKSRETRKHKPKELPNTDLSFALENEHKNNIPMATID